MILLFQIYCLLCCWSPHNSEAPGWRQDQMCPSAPKLKIKIIRITQPCHKLECETYPYVVSEGFVGGRLQAFPPPFWDVKRHQYLKWKKIIIRVSLWHSSVSFTHCCPTTEKTVKWYEIDNWQLPLPGNIFLVDGPLNCAFTENSKEWKSPRHGLGIYMKCILLSNFLALVIT